MVTQRKIIILFIQAFEMLYCSTIMEEFDGIFIGNLV